MLQLQNMCIKTRQIDNELEILTPYKMNMMSYIDQLLEKISWIKNVAEKGMFDKRKKDEKRVYILYLYSDQNWYLFKISNINCCFVWWNKQMHYYCLVQAAVKSLLASYLSAHVEGFPHALENSPSL